MAQSSLTLDDIAARLSAQRLPPVDRWAPSHEARIDMCIKRDGSWHYLGSPIQRPAMVKLFSTVLRRDGDGRHYLVTPAEKLEITVEDCAFVAVELVSEGVGRERRLGLRLNTDDVVLVDAAHPLSVSLDAAGHPRPVVQVRGGLEALVARPVYYELVDMALSEDADGLWSAGTYFSLDGAAA
jgi:uncharacterized protein